MSEALLLVCPKCGTRVRVPEGEAAGRCEACNTVVDRVVHVRQIAADEQRLTPRAVLIGSLLLLVAGAFGFSTFKKGGRREVDPAPVAHGEEPRYEPPDARPAEQALAGELAWEVESRAPVIVAANAEPTEDIFGFYRVWDGRSAWVSHGGVFDGATLQPIWQTDALAPQIVKREDVLPTAVAVGDRLVVSDATATLQVFDLASGDRLRGIPMTGDVIGMCRAPDDKQRIWVQVSGDQHAFVDVETGKTTAAPHPAWCSLPEPAKEAAAPHPRRSTGPEASVVVAPPVAACSSDFRNRLTHASCATPDEVLAPAGAKGHYVLRDGSGAVVLATKDDRPIALGVGPDKRTSWAAPLVADATKPTPEVTHVADLAGGRLYAVAPRVYFDARLVALDASSGARLWDVPLVGSMPSSYGETGRGEAKGLMATKARVYVTRAGGGLDVFDASDGRAIGTIGKK